MSAQKLFLTNALLEMVKIRAVEEKLQQTFLEQKVFSFLHLMLGQEASPVGVCAALEAEDLMMGNHRSHGHYLAKGGDMGKMIKEILGDLSGCCAGYGGSMHMLDRSVGFEGSTPILGSVSTLIVGKALGLKLSNTEAVATCFLGDGAAEEGIFYESVNLACSKELPVIFIIEDNKYAVNTRHSDRKSERYDFKKVFEGLGAGYNRADGRDVESVFSAVSQARMSALAGIPYVTHIDVDRLHGHSGPLYEKETPEYREQNDSIEKRRKRDCIDNLMEKLVSLQFYNSDEVAQLVGSERQKISLECEKIIGEIHVRD